MTKYRFFRIIKNILSLSERGVRTPDGRPYNMQIKRKDYRLKHYDYSSPNAYFITICTKDRYPLLWEDTPYDNVGAAIGRPQIYELSDYGKVTETAITNIPSVYPTVKIDKYVIMPNHIHMIITICDKSDSPSTKIPTIINQMKGYVSKNIGFSPWQKLYYDHIIRSEEEFINIWQYIDDNPRKWLEDEEYIDLSTQK